MDFFNKVSGAVRFQARFLTSVAWELSCIYSSQGGSFSNSAYKMFFIATYLGEYLSRFSPFKDKKLDVQCP